MRALTTTTKRIIVLGLAAFGLMAGVAVATTGVGVSSTPLVRGTVAEPLKVETDGLVELKTEGPIDVVDQTLTIQPGGTIQPVGHTGWHSHPGPALAVIKSGTLTLYDGDDPNCEPHAYNAGQAFVDRGGGHVHIARNEGTTPVEVSVTYLTPVGAGPRTDVTPAPGNCEF
jgi:quercetin dioxygenase-like cupin family protein